MRFLIFIYIIAGFASPQRIAMQRFQSKSNHRDSSHGSSGRNSGREPASRAIVSGIFHCLEKAAEDCRDRSNLKKFDGENPADWLPTRKIGEDWINSIGCLEVILPGIRLASDGRTDANRPDSNLSIMSGSSFRDGNVPGAKFSEILSTSTNASGVAAPTPQFRRDDGSAVLPRKPAVNLDDTFITTRAGSILAPVEQMLLEGKVVGDMDQQESHRAEYSILGRSPNTAGFDEDEYEDMNDRLSRRCDHHLRRYEENICCL
jgi:hypothetical protein